MSKKIRYAVVGLGNLSQVAILPAFAHAKENSELVAFFTDDLVKEKALTRKYGVENSYRYQDFEKGLKESNVEAVYIVLPNSLHREYTLRAADAGVHILCEKPMAVTAEDCREMIAAAARNRVKLMVAYRLHFERSNLEAIALLASGELGEPRIFNSTFSMQVSPGDVRTRHQLGGGTLYDLGPYPINAARYLFRAEPVEVSAFSSSGKDLRSQEVDEMTSALLRFPGGRLASFVTSFGAADEDFCEVLGTKGRLRIFNGYGYTHEVIHEITVGDKTRRVKYRRRDQFAPELIAFSDNILHDTEPEPSGHEGLLDVEIIRALYQSAQDRRPIPLQLAPKRRRPDLSQKIDRPPVRKQEPVHAPSPSK